MFYLVVPDKNLNPSWIVLLVRLPTKNKPSCVCRFDVEWKKWAEESIGHLWIGAQRGFSSYARPRN
jgi:hypothetical protein